MSYAINGLIEINALDSLNLLSEEKKVVFNNLEVPIDCEIRREFLRNRDSFQQEYQDKELDILDQKFWAEPDQLSEKLVNFANKHALYENF
ncbi:DUF4375 domain-containing protein [Acinetobacter sp. NIPH 2699]|uniref:DMP19 family protein n=1 Tax=Acinetobacter sp. NIPH 2699 TaxID=2923433 RepID=UPI001F4B3A76|nr:DUF4375 domain-containing protein [Acinetobacter sp. NIPH 2699]MCH7335595.1 DUF4375 domain-containing protein [Acinetobacter sp. NIPH 2699]